EDDDAAIADTRRVLEILLDAREDGHVHFGAGDEVDAVEVSAETLMADSTAVVDLLVDDGSFVAFEHAPGSGLRTGLARVAGWLVVVAAAGGEDSAVLGIDDVRRLRRAWQLAGRRQCAALLVQDCAGYDDAAEADLEGMARLVAEIRRAGCATVTVVTGKG